MDIQLTKTAAKQIKKINQPLKDRIFKAVRTLPDGNVKKLQGYGTKYRLRVGDYRIIFDMSGDQITIGEILPRGDAYNHP